MSEKTESGDLVVNIVLKANFSWLTALKLRLAGGDYIKTFIDQQIKEANKNVHNKISKETSNES